MTQDIAQDVGTGTKAGRSIFSVGFITPLTVSKKADSFFKIIEPLCELDFDMSVLAFGDESSQEACFDYAEKYRERFNVLESVPKNKDTIISNSQVIIFTDKPEKDILKKLSKKGVIAVIPEAALLEGLENFDPQQEKGNCFAYDINNHWDLLATVLRAYETFKFPYDWSNCKKNFKKVIES